MNVSNPALVVLAGALCFTGACGATKPAPAGPPGKINISTVAKASSAAHENTAGDDICAKFTLTPYSFDASGNPVLAGGPISFTTSSASVATDQILGCTDGAKTFNYTAPAGTTDYASGKYNWAYLVTASNFAYCSSADGTLDTTTVNPAPAYFAPVNCDASADSTLAIDYPIALSEAAPTGYIDISAGVDATTQYVGCKTADISGGELHFGESNAVDGLTPIPLGLIGFTTTSAPSDAEVAQYGGQTLSLDPNHAGATLYNTYYTGQFTAGTSALPSALLQTYLTNSAESHLFGAIGGDASCTGGEWVDSRHAYCLTTGADADAPSTSGKLADAFLFLPGIGYAAANVDSGGSGLTLYSQFTPNSASDYSASAVATANAAPGFTGTSAEPASGQGGFNDRLVTTLLAPSTVGTTILKITGVYIDPSIQGQFIVGETDGSENSWATLSFSPSSGWTLGAPTAFSAGPVPAGFGVSSSGCITAPPPSFVCNPSGTPFGGGSGTPADPYKVCSAGHLNNVRTNLTANYVQTTDIDLSSIVGPTLGSGGTPVSWNAIGQYTGGSWVGCGSPFPTHSTFTGSYNGNNHAIANLYSFSTAAAQSNKDDSVFEGYGLFGIAGGPISNVKLVNPTVNEGNRPNVGTLVGALVGSGSVTNSSSQGGAVSGYVYIGGLIGRAQESAVVADSWSSTTVTSASTVGTNGDSCGWGAAGLIGGISAKYGGNACPGSLVSNVTVTRSYATGSVNGGGDGNGGLIGYLISGAHVTQSFATGTVTCTPLCGAVYGCGGLVGEVETNGTGISDSYSTGAVNANPGAGSIGHINSGVASNIYSAAPSVSTAGANQGPFAGVIQGTNTAADLFYWNGASPLPAANGMGAGLNGTAMETEGSYTGFDFTTPVWKMPAANPFSATVSAGQPILAPVLAWQCGLNGVVCH